MRGVVGGGFEEEVEGGGRVGSRSPRMQTSAQITVRPPRMMCWVPCSWERRETLLPVSVVTKVGLGVFEGAEGVLVGGLVVGGMVGGESSWRMMGIGDCGWRREVIRVLETIKSKGLP